VSGVWCLASGVWCLASGGWCPPTLTNVDPEARGLLEAFVGAYRPYLRERLTERGLPMVDDALTAGEQWLRVSLEALLVLPFASQRRSPLEVFQEAMRFPTDALDALGTPEPARDSVAEAALPGDRYDLAPASSQALGEAAWRAHLAWGAAKARAHTGPSVILVSRNLLDAAKVGEAASRVGYDLTVAARRPGGERRFTVGLVDLEHPDADEAVRTLAGTCGRVVAYGPHVDDLAMVRARTLGAAEALPRSRFFTDPAAWLPAPV